MFQYYKESEGYSQKLDVNNHFGQSLANTYQGPDSAEFNFLEAANKWAAIRDRRLFNS